MACTDEMNYRLIEKCSNAQAEEWLRRHKLVYQEVFCERNHERRLCKQVNDRWICPVRTCRSRVPAAGPLLTVKRERDAKETLTLIYTLGNSFTRKDIAQDGEFSLKVITRFSRAFEEIVAQAHDLRRERAAGTAKFIQKDETCFSRVKRRGCNKNKRTRRKGSTWANVIVITDVDQKAKEGFVSVLQRRTNEAMNPEVIALAANARTEVRDGVRMSPLSPDVFRASAQLAQHVRHRVVVHKKEWVSSTGVHTNTVESFNNRMKFLLKKRGNRLGKSEKQRAQRLKFIAEQCNGLIKRGSCKECVLRRLFQDIALFCESVCSEAVSREVDETEHVRESDGSEGYDSKEYKDIQ